MLPMEFEPFDKKEEETIKAIIKEHGKVCINTVSTDCDGVTAENGNTYKSYKKARLSIFSFYDNAEGNSYIQITTPNNQIESRTYGGWDLY
jgi:hypothetical protein